MRTTTLSAAIAVAAIFFGATTARAQNGRDTTPTITATGEATVSAKPDRVDINIGVMRQADNAEDAQRRLRDSIKGTLNAVDDLELEGVELTTTGVSLQPNYDHSQARDGKPPRITGYTASTTVRVRTSALDRVGEVLDAAVESGSNQINGVDFYLDNESPLLIEALGQAVGEAKSKAESMAKGLGVELGSVLAVTESGGVIPFQPKYEFAAMRADAGGDSPTRVEAGAIQVRGSVTVVFEIKQ